MFNGTEIDYSISDCGEVRKDTTISRVCSGTNIRHKGYKWKLVEEIVQEDIE